MALAALAACASPAPVITIDVRGPQATLDDLLDWESRHGRVPDGATVVFRGAREAAPDLVERATTWRVWSGVRFEERKRARLIEFGWDIPDTAYLREHVRDMEKAPFDGVVLDPSIGRDLRFSWHVFGRERLPDAVLDGAIADLRATRFARFRHNFLRLNATPGDLAWDTPDAMLANVRLAARLVREARLAGLFFDTESYQAKLWSTGAPADVRRAGREFGRAYDAPGTTILLAFAITQASHPEYRLLAPFVEGLLEGAVSVEIVDAYENAYGFKDGPAFERARDAIRRSHPRLRAGFGLWMDFESGRRGWPANPHFSPAEFERAVRAASAAGDGWVWIYTERVNWWKDPPGPYADAIRNATP
jgi:hypothetical protein